MRLRILPQEQQAGDGGEEKAKDADAKKTAKESKNLLSWVMESLGVGVHAGFPRALDHVGLLVRNEHVSRSPRQLYVLKSSWINSKNA